ncbi:MAG: FliG C-terminal domain-containing protein [Planctomycetaceae bacterium]|jgi:hypothetical protein
MNPWSNFATQVRQRLGLLSLKQQAALGGVMGLGLLAGGWYFASQPATPAAVPLWGGQALPTAEIRTAQAKLKEAGVTDVRVVRGQLLVPPDQVAHCESVLQSLAPASEAPSSRFEKALGQAAWSVSETHRQELLDSARASDLVAMFKKDPHIADARLMWNRSRKRSFQSDARMTVVLNITPRPGKRIPASLAESLKTAVVSTFGLASPQDVSLIEFGPDGAQLVRHAEAPAVAETRPPRSLADRNDEVELAEHSVSHPGSPRTYAADPPAGREAARLATLTAPTVSDTPRPLAAPRRAPNRTGSRAVADPRAKLQTRLEQQLAWIPQVEVTVTDRAAERRDADLLPSAVPLDQPPQVTVLIPSVVTRSLLQPGERPETATGPTGKPRRSRIDVRRKVEQLVRKELQLGPRVPAREFVTVTFQEDPVAGDDLWSNPITCYLTALDWRRVGPWLGGGLAGMAVLGLLARRRFRRQAAATIPFATPPATSPAPAGGTTTGTINSTNTGAAAATPRGEADGKAETGEAAATPAGSPRRRPAPAAASVDEGEEEASPAAPGSRGTTGWTESSRAPRHRSPSDEAAGDEAATGFDLDSIRPPRGASAKATSRRGAGWDPASPAPASFAQLNDCSAEEWHELLEDEQPQTIAVILSQLPAAQSSFVLRMMPAANRLDVVRRMTALETPAAAVLQELATTLATRLRQVRAARASREVGLPGGLGTPTLHPPHGTPPAPRLRHLAMYAQPPAGLDRGPIMTPTSGAGLPRTRPGDLGAAETPPAGVGPAYGALPLAEETVGRGGRESPAGGARPQPVTLAGADRESKFTDLAMLDDNSLRELFAQFDSEHWAVALRGADEPLIAKLVHALAMGDAQHLSGARSALGPVRLGDVDAAQRAIAERLAPLRYRGRAIPSRFSPVPPGFEEPA